MYQLMRPIYASKYGANKNVFVCAVKVPRPVCVFPFYCRINTISREASNGPCIGAQAKRAVPLMFKGKKDHVMFKLCLCFTARTGGYKSHHPTFRFDSALSV